MNSLLIFIGAGLGGVARFWVANLVYAVLGRQFPFGTLVVNVSGCLLMGLLFVLTIERFGSLATHLRALLLIGLLGGYTTFSSFSIETLNLFESGNWSGGLLNVVFTTLLCLLATWIGVIGGRLL